jgi:hypothetical protein
MLDWIDDHSTFLWITTAVSIVVLVASFFLVPFVVGRIRP